MSTREDGAPGDLVRSRDDLVAWIAAGEKPKPAWRIGTEHEKFVFHTDTLTPVPYEGERSIARADGGPHLHASAGSRSSRAGRSSP